MPYNPTGEFLSKRNRLDSSETRRDDEGVSDAIRQGGVTKSQPKQGGLLQRGNSSGGFGTISLTSKQTRFYAALKKYIEKNKTSPTIEELQELLDISSPRGVVQYLEALEKKGLVLRAKGEARGIYLKEVGDTPKVEIPVFASAGCDNVMTMAERIFDEYVCVAKDLLHDKNQKAVVGIRASGDSMNDAGINDGDYVLCEMTENIRDNDLVVAIIDSFAVIKKIEYANNAVILRPVSSDASYKPIILHRDFRIFGKVIDVLRSPQKGELDIVPLYSKI